MEYCDGGDMFNYLSKRGFALEESRAAVLLHKLATAVYYMHSYGIAHRDLKPENILMTCNTDEADLKILDFGLGKIIGPHETANEPYGTLVI
jgi:serine/threonine protein kinase